MEHSEFKIREMRLHRMRPTVVSDGMPHTHNSADLSSYVAMLEQEEKRYMRYRYQQIKKCKEITDKIEQLYNEDERDILMYQYIKMMIWDDICVTM